MKSPLPFRLRKLRLEAADAPRVDLSGPTRCERDLLGERDIPVDALYGIQTLRAMENFCISGIELREPAQSRGDDGATSNSRNGPLSVTLYVLILKNP